MDTASNRDFGQSSGRRRSVVVRDTPWGDRVAAYEGDISLGPDFPETGVSWAHELNALATIVRPGDVVLDVGANIGYLTCYLAHLTGSTGHVFAVEPDPELIDLLKHNVANNGYDTVTIAQLVLGPHNGVVELWRSRNNLGRHSLYPANVPDAAGTTSVQQRRGDQFWRDNLSSGQVGVLKLDVEGAELDVLRSAPGLLGATRDVWLEFWPDGVEASGSDPYEIVKLLWQADFQLTYWNLVTGVNSPVPSAESLRHGIDEMSTQAQHAGGVYSPILYLHASRPDRTPDRTS